MTLRAEWDGDRALGTLRLGMSLAEVLAAADLDDVHADPPDPYDDEGDASYSSESAALRLDLFRDVVWSINAFSDFWVRGSNLIGLDLDELRAVVGEVRRDPADPTALDPATDYFTFLGPDALEFLFCEGQVVCVSLTDVDLLPDD